MKAIIISARVESPFMGLFFIDWCFALLRCLLGRNIRSRRGECETALARNDGPSERRFRDRDKLVLVVLLELMRF